MTKIKDKLFVLITVLAVLLAVLLAYRSDARQKIRVMEVDTGVSLSHKLISDHVPKSEQTKADYFDTQNHGTHIAGIILKNVCPQIELISCKYIFLSNPLDNLENSINCFKRALNENIDIINYSSYGNMSDINEYDALKALSDKNVVFVTAAGNDNKDISKFYNPVYPAKYDLKNLIVVGNLNDDGTKAATSNYGLKKMVWEKGMYVPSTFTGGVFGTMSGTSQATARRTNRILLKWCQENQ